MDLLVKLEELRMQLRLTKEEMSMRMGYARNTYYKWTNKREPIPRACKFFLELIFKEAKDLSVVPKAKHMANIDRSYCTFCGKDVSALLEIK